MTLISFRLTEEKSFLQQQFIEQRNEFEDQIKLFDSQLGELQTNLNEKMIELDEGKASEAELHEEIERLEADVNDKTKVS